MKTMYYKFFSLTLDEPFFWFCALAGAGLFFIQLLLIFFGADHDNMDAGGELDVGKLKWLSKQALSGFLLMFGLVGLTCKKEFSLAFFPAALIGCSVGSITIFLNGGIFKIAQKLRSTGTVFNISDAIGKEAMVYQRIPQGGIGKIVLSLHNLTHELDAISHEQEDLPSFITVCIIQQSDDKTVVVVPKK